MFPLLIPLLGAGAGALFNKKDPLKGALMGGALGFGGAALPGLLGAGGATAGVTGGSQAGLLAAQEAGLGATGGLGWGGATTGIQGGLNSALGAGAGAQTGGLLSNAGKLADTAKPIMSAVEATQPPPESMISPVAPHIPSTGPGGLASLVQSNQQAQLQNEQEAMQRRLAQRARYGMR